MFGECQEGEAAVAQVDGKEDHQQCERQPQQRPVDGVAEPADGSELEHAADDRKDGQPDACLRDPAQPAAAEVAGRHRGDEHQQHRWHGSSR